MRIPTAAYCRLSMEGEESIENQIQLVEGYIQDSPDLLLVDTYVDNGFTGTSFDRPEWNRLMLDVQQGRINEKLQFLAKGAKEEHPGNKNP